MNIAAIDPGITTGIAVAHVLINEDKIVLRHLDLSSYTQHQDVFYSINRHAPDTIFLERRAANGAKEGFEPFYQIVNGLSAFGYIEAPNGKRKMPGEGPKGLILIGPGLWKPFMKSVMASHDFSTGSWSPRTQHEKDALGLLHFGLLFVHSSQGKVVVYE